MQVGLQYRVVVIGQGGDWERSANMRPLPQKPAGRTGACAGGVELLVLAFGGLLL